VSRYTFMARPRSYRQFILKINNLATFCPVILVKLSRHWQNNEFGGELWGEITPAPQKPRLLEQVKIACRQKHYSRTTEKSYVFWIRQYILFHNKRHPNEMGQQEIEAYLNHMAARRNVSASTQSSALNALAFLYRTVLQIEMPELETGCQIDFKFIKLKQLSRQPCGQAWPVSDEC